MAKSIDPDFAGESKGSSKPGDKRIHLVVVTPERTVLDTLVDFVAIPLFDGEAGILPGRAPLIGRLGFGELRGRVGETVDRYFVDGGFAQIRDNSATILTPRAISVGDVDVAAAEADLKALESTKATTELESADRDRGLARARGLIRIAGKKG